MSQPDTSLEAGSDGSNPGGDVSETTLQELVSLRDELHARLDTQSTKLQTLRDELNEERQQREQLEQQLAQRDERIQTLEQRLAEVDQRTDMLELVETSDDLDGEDRSKTLIQHLQRAAHRRRERDEPAAASVDRDEAEAALHHPDVDRTTIYRDMERAVRLVGDDDLLRYEDGELRLDLRDSTLPAEFTDIPTEVNL